jgi:chromosome partitioning protein
MRHITVMNAKGGCGKSTIATNLASYYASEGASVVLADFDPQQSSLDWLARRPAHVTEIVGLSGFSDGLKGLPRTADVVIMDAPARSHGPELTELLKRTETVVVPVLPSTIDMQAAAKFIEELMGSGKVQRSQVKVGVVANRVRQYTLIFDELDQFLGKQKVPYPAALRDAQNYVRAYTRGLGVFELPEYLAWPDWEQWEPLLKWLKSKRSQP